jgi:hypothetical protein
MCGMHVACLVGTSVALARATVRVGAWNVPRRLLDKIVDADAALESVIFWRLNLLPFLILFFLFFFCG